MVLEDMLLILLLTFVVLATSSAWVVKQSVEEEDAVSARAWAAVFFLSSLLAALLFWLIGWDCNAGLSEVLAHSHSREDKELHMARRLSIQEEQEIVAYIRANPQASVRAVAHRFGRSRPTIDSLRSRYALDKPLALNPDPDEPPPHAASSVDMLAELRKVDEELEAEWASLRDAERAAELKKGSGNRQRTGGFLDWPAGSF
jgi:hypothetical protein